jgi:hypothetical protein
MATKPGARKTGLAVAQPPQVFYRINSLLHTLRSIAQREDQLCILMHHLRTSGKLNATLSAELHEILDEIPAEEYMHDLECLREALESAEGKQTQATSTRARTAPKRRAA